MMMGTTTQRQVLTLPIRSQHHGTVKDGKFIAEDAQSFKRSFYSFEGKRVTVSVGAFVKRRSNRQNRYLWGVVYKLLAEHTGHTVDEVHDACKAKFCAPKEVCGVMVSGDTKSLDTVELEEYAMRVRVWCSELGLYVPKPNEVEL